MSEGDREDIDVAVAAAREAFDRGPWPRMAASVRHSFPFYHLSSSLNNVN